MRRRSPAVLLVTFAPMALAACSKLVGGYESAPSASVAEAAPPVATVASTVETSKTPISYPAMVPASGSFTVPSGATVYQGADNTSPALGFVAKGTITTQKGNLNQWKLIEWQSGPNQTSSGWIETSGAPAAAAPLSSAALAQASARAEADRATKEAMDKVIAEASARAQEAKDKVRAELREEREKADKARAKAEADAKAKAEADAKKKDAKKK